ncbi:MAG: hypothetical protein ACTHWF_05425 [Brachybacterium sp.]|uniref:hypothetical protein n=1 Tax=Brachybacterium sp. Z12 TaxID=2759167 RepID=UPI00186249C5|nr:hypothetical protein [Brachybacterium sp. Z12]QNN82484.1 hypothetical protein H3H54_16255 [Brachybacterium sp. Z12]
MTQPQNPAEDPELDGLAVEEEREEVSIDDALETDRVVAEGPDSRNADGYGFDSDRDRGGDESTAAEQGNRDEDRMEAETAEQELPEV